MKINTKLILLITLFVIIPMASIGTLSFYSSKANLEQARLAALGAIADLKKDQIVSFFEHLNADIRIAQKNNNIKTNLPIVSNLDDKASPSYTRARQALNAELGAWADYKYEIIDLMLVNLEGKIVYTNNPEHAPLDLGNPLPDPGNKAFSKGREGIYLTDIFRNEREKNRLTMIVSAPAYSHDNKLTGVIAIQIAMEGIYRLIGDTTGLGKTGETLIGKNTGGGALFLNPLRHDRDAALKKSSRFGEKNAFPMQEAVSERDGAGISVDYRGEKVIAAWRHIPSSDWGIVAKIDLSEAFAPIITMQNRTLLFSILVTLFGIVVTLKIAASFTSPILKLKEDIKIIGCGELSRRSGISSHDEIGELAQGINLMAANLEDREGELKAAHIKMQEREDRLMRQNSILGDMVRLEMGEGEDLKKAIMEINQAAAYALDVERVSVWLYNEDHSAMHCLDLYEQKDGSHTGGMEISAEDYPSYFNALKKEVTIAAHDAHGDPRTREFSESYLSPHNISSMLDAPIRSAGKTIGIVCNEHAGDIRRWQLDEENFASQIAELVALKIEGLERIRLMRELEKKTSELLKSEENLSEAQRIAHIGSWELDLVKNELTWSDEEYRIFGVDKSEFRASYEAFLETVHPDDRALVDNDYTESLKNKTLHDIEHRLLMKDGTIKYVHERCETFYDKEGKPLRSIGTTQDITEHKKTQEMLLRSARLASIGELAANVAHEINNPMTAIMAYASLMMEEMDKEDRFYPRIEVINKESLRIRDIVKNLLDFSRHRKTNRQKSSINDVVSGSLNLVRSINDVKNIRIKTDYGKDIPYINIDPDQMKQVFLNLITNACHAVQGAGTLSVKTTLADSNVIIAIGDDGDGISKNVIKNIFDPFFSTKGEKGTGLGLSVSYGIVKNHGGDILAQSEEGVGTEFKVLLPI